MVIDEIATPLHAVWGYDSHLAMTFAKLNSTF